MQHRLAASGEGDGGGKSRIDDWDLGKAEHVTLSSTSNTKEDAVAQSTRGHCGKQLRCTEV
jgi:hypothetical protein